jgi:hypothetical protein
LLSPKEPEIDYNARYMQENYTPFAMNRVICYFLAHVRDYVITQYTQEDLSTTLDIHPRLGYLPHFDENNNA